MKPDTREQVSNVLKRFIDSAHQTAHALLPIVLDEYERFTAARDRKAHVTQPGEPEKWLTVKEVAAMLQISDRTIYEWAKQGKMPGQKMNGEWRFLQSELLEWKLPEKRDTQLTRPRHTKSTHHLKMVNAKG